MSNSIPNVFLLNLEIGDDLIGSITRTLDLGVSPINETVDGRSVVFQAINPVLHVQSIVTGTYNYLCTNTSCHIMITLTGYIDNGSSCLKNFEARILLEDDWKSGTANYSFLNDGKWTKVSNQKVKAVDTNGINDLGQLAKEANH